MSKPFSFELSLLAEPDANLEEILLGQPATLSFNIPARAPRLVRGTVVSVEPFVPAAVQGRHAYRLRFVPRLWLLRHRITSRIFQDRTVPEIVSAVLREANVDDVLRFSLCRTVRPGAVLFRGAL
jgi:type VI secretion system secreted protein VgrG